MPLSIQFTKGSLAGRVFAIGETELEVGRSHACAIRPAEDDVSGHHVTLSAEGGALVLKVMSSHRTRVNGVPAKAGATLSLAAGTVVELGSRLAFRVTEGAANPVAGDTTSILPQPPRRGSETGMFTEATRFGGTETFSQLGNAPAVPAYGDTDTSPLSATAATRAGTLSQIPQLSPRAVGDEATTAPSSLTAATRAAEEGETSFFGASTGSIAPGAQEETDSGVDETQVLQTQVASREELEKLREIYQRKKTRRITSRLVVLSLVALVAVGISVYYSTRKPEFPLSMPKEGQSCVLLPDLAPQSLKKDLSGTVGLSFPSVGARVARREGAVEVRTLIGRNLDVEVVVVAEVFGDAAALSEPRWTTFRRYLAHSSELVSILDNMYPLPEEDFFGGRSGLRRGVPCSRAEYWRMRGRDHVYGVVSFFRNGSLCCALRREVAAAEKERAERLLARTQRWLWTDPAGAFAAAQWEGAEEAGCKDPAVELTRCEGRFALDSPLEWPEIEHGLRDVLAETDGDDANADVHSRALKLLADLRERKALYWKQLVASRVPLAQSGGKLDRMRAIELDDAVRKGYPTPDEEWYFLARRRKWWE